MSKEKVYIFDTTLRDGAQTEGVDFTVSDKIKIAKNLNDIGVDYIEGGWPGANPTDTEYFNTPQKLDKSIFTAFGMTKKLGRSADNDPTLSPILNANTKAVCIVGKSWDFHVDVALGITKEENLINISETAKYFIKNKREFIFDGIKEAQDDYIMFSDPDEIPNPKKLKNFYLKKKYGIFLQNMYTYKLNLYNKQESPWEGTRICEKKNLKSVDWLRHKILSKNLKYGFWRLDKEKNIEIDFIF